MNTDAFFTMGREHTVCQDYALAGPDFIAVSDGCSQSTHSDFGARFMCRMAAIHGPGLAAAEAAKLFEPLRLHIDALNATLLFAKMSQDAQWVDESIHGDGVIAARFRDPAHGKRLIISRSFPSGAPLYPSYDLTPERRAQYHAEYGTEVVTLNETTHRSDSWAQTIGDGAGVAAFSSQVELFDLVLLLSDGALSFRRPAADGGTEAVPLNEIVDAMLDIKTNDGNFIVRRAKRFLRDVGRLGWFHNDDFAVAAMYLGKTL